MAQNDFGLGVRSLTKTNFMLASFRQPCPIPR
jgi:hypothetical protein